MTCSPQLQGRPGAVLGHRPSERPKFHAILPQLCDMLNMVRKESVPLF